ncbi:hypothetical protein [Methanobrevibacter sp.]
MDNKKIILIAIVVLVIILAIFGAYIATKESGMAQIANKTSNKTVINVDLANNTTGNSTVVGDNSTRVNETANNNTTHKVYNPQSDSYVDVIGEKFDSDVNRWYTYDTDGVRYYNTRIN